MTTNSKNFKAKNGIDAGGNITAPEIHATVKLVADTVGGDEGGEIYLGPALTNTTLAGGVTIDVYQNKLRFFEQGGSARGYYIDMSGGGTGVSTNLVGGGSASNSFTTISTPSGTSPVADSSTDTLTLTAGSGISITGDATADSITIANTGYYSGGTDVPLADGGTNASLTASNGGIVYSTASAMAILSGTATARQTILSGSSTTPSWSPYALPATVATNQALYASSSTVITAGTLPVAAGGTGTGTASITAFNNITGYSSTGATGTTSTNIVFSTSPTLTTPTIDTINTSLTTTGTAALWNTGITSGTISIGGALTGGTMSLANGSSFTGTINIANSSISGHTVNISSAASLAGTRTINIGTGGAAGTTNITIGNSSGTTTIGSPTVTLSNATAFNINGTSPVAISSTAASASVFNTTTTTLNIGGAATSVSIGAATGTTTINNASTVVTGDLAVNGGDITTSSTTFNLLTAATTLGIGAATGTTTVNNNFKVAGLAEVVYNTDSSSNPVTVYTGETAPSSPATGDLWIDGSSSSANSNILRWRALATAGQTSITGTDTSGTVLSYTAGYEQVYINGVLLYRGTDYTATNGTSITITSALTLNDTIEIVSPQLLNSGDYYTQAQSDAKYPVVATDQISGFRNVFINGGFAIDQRNSGGTQTFNATVTNAYCVDRWYVYFSGSGGTLGTGARIAGTAPNQYSYRLTGASANTGLNFGQRIEASNSYHLAGQTTTLSVSLASSSITSVTWTAYYANTTDTFGGPSTAYTRTQIATGTFTINSTLTRYTTNITIPSAATTGIEIVFTTGALTATNTMTFAAPQLEVGDYATPFERRPIGTELALCQRYYYRAVGGSAYSVFGRAQAITTTTANAYINLPVSMRAIPSTAFETTGTASNYGITLANGTVQALTSVPTISGNSNTTEIVGAALTSTTGGLVAGQGLTFCASNSSSAYLGITAEL